MPLTPEDVSNKRFTAVRLREGYDMGEVDQFLDEVEAELTRLVNENEELRAKVEALQSGQPVQEAPVTLEKPAEEAPEEQPAEEPQEQAAPEPEPEPEPEPTPEPEPVREEPAAPAPAVAERREPETIKVTTTAEASMAATRLLELAGRNADELVAEAREQAEQIVSEARTEAQSLQEEARARAEQLDSETQERRQQLMGDLEREREELGAEVDRLKDFERSYRAELKGYFEQQLQALEGRGEPGTLSAQSSQDGEPGA
jgi:DivIVA domain-containing protein